MSRFRLSTLLILFNSGLALSAIAVVAFAAAGLLRRLADDQALARVAQAGQGARNALQRAAQGTLTQAQLLSERPTLLRLTRADEAAALQDFLAQFQATSRLAGAAVWRNGAALAASGLDPAAWERMAAEIDAAAAGTAYLAPAEAGPYLLAAWAAVPDEAGTYALTALALDAGFAAELSTEVGLPVQLSQLAAAAPGLAPAQAAALARGESLSFKAAGPERYLALLPLPAGGLLEAELAATETAASVRALTQSVSVLAVGVALAVALLSAGASRWLSRPLGALTRAAEQIGRGDFSAPVPRAPRGEIGLLAETLDEMRRRLGTLTQDLQAQQAETRAVLAGISEGVFAVDRERRVRYINPQAAALLGLTPEAAVGRFCGDVLNPDGPVRPCEEQCPIIHARFQAGARAVERLRRADGGRRSVVVTSAAPGAEAGGFRQIQVLRDETDVEAARRARDAVLANISHEFRTPLSAQLASLELLLDQLPELSQAQVRELVISLQRGALRLTQLIDNLLESVRVEAGQTAVRRGPVALDEVVEQALELTRPLLLQRGQAVDVNLPYPLPAVAGDAPRLVQVFVNLLANANKYAPVDSTIRIGGAAEPGWLTLWVADEGPGLPPAAEGGVLFAPFVRSGGDEPAERGIGLGLYIVRSIVERHGGSVRAENQAPGARFTLRLPAANERPAASEPPTGEAQP